MFISQLLIDTISLNISKNISFITSTRADRNGGQKVYNGPIAKDEYLAKEPVLFIDSYIHGSYYYKKPVICMSRGISDIWEQILQKASATADLLWRNIWELIQNTQSNSSNI